MIIDRRPLQKLPTTCIENRDRMSGQKKRRTPESARRGVVSARLEQVEIVLELCRQQALALQDTATLLLHPVAAQHFNRL
jgi:hypothetical protein